MPQNQNWIADLLTGGPGGGGSTTTTAAYNQPAQGSTVVVSVADTTSAATGNAATVNGTQKYTVTNVGNGNVTLLNDTLTNTGAAVPSGAVVVFSGPSAPNRVAPRFVTDLATTQPAGTRSVVHVDGYASVDDGGHGKYHWLSTYDGPADPLHIYPTGFSPSNPGAWVREIGTDNVINAAMFGAKGDAFLIGGNTISGTDDTAAIQALLDYNSRIQTSQNYRSYVAKLNATPTTLDTTLIPARTMYRVKAPLQVNDQYLAPVGNTTQVFEGEPGAQSGLFNNEFLGPMIVAGFAAGGTPSPVLDPNGSGEWCIQLGPVSNGPVPTIASGSNLAVLPQATIFVNSTDGLPYAGQIIHNLTGVMITWTGKTTTTLTGCTQTSPAGPLGQTLHTGDTLALLPTPQWGLTDCDVGDINGWTGFTFEFFINPGDSNTWINEAPRTGGWTSSMFGMAGRVGDATHPVFPFHQTMFLELDGTAGSAPRYLFTLVTSNSGGTVYTSNTTDHCPPPNTLTHVEISWSAATGNLDLFINGAQPDAGTMHASGITGVLAQKWYEILSIGSGRNAVWPFGCTGGDIQTAPPCLLGRMRLSRIKRHNAPFTAPLPSAVVCDGDTRWFQDFDPNTVKTFPSGWQSPSIPTRPGLAAWNIGQCGFGTYGQVVNGVGFPVWIYNRSIVGQPYTSGTRIRSMLLRGIGEAIHAFSALNSEFGEDSIILGNENGVIFDNFSYNSGIGKNCQFLYVGLPNASIQPNFNAHEVYFGPGSQFSYIRKGWLSGNSGANWQTLCVFTDILIESGFANSYHRGTYAFIELASKVTVEATTLDDGTTGFADCGVLLAPTTGAGCRFKYSGSYIGMKNSSIPVILIGSDQVTVEVDVPVFATPCSLFSFQGRAANGLGFDVYPAVTHAPPTNIAAITDAANPGPVAIPNRARRSHTITMASANLVLDVTNGDALYGFYNIAGTSSSGNSIEWPQNPGAVYEGANASGATVHLICHGSSSPVSVTNGSPFRVRDNGTDLVAL